MARRSLRDGRALERILARINRLRSGNFGDAKSVGKSVSELRIDYGPGYRVYFTRRGKTVVIAVRRRQANPGPGHQAGDRDGEGFRLMSLKTRPYDAANYLKTGDNIASYLEAVLEDGDPESLRLALDDVARTPIAKEAGLPPLPDDVVKTLSIVLKTLGIGLSATHEVEGV